MSDAGAQPQPHRPGTVERAYELARTGQYATIEQIRATLIREQHVSVQQHLSGPTLRRELLKLCRAMKVEG